MELPESASRYQAIFEAAIDGIITINTKGLIDSVNQSAAQIFGYDKEEMVGQNVSMLMPSPDRENHDQYLANYLRTGDAKIIGIGREVTGQKKNGKTFPFRLSISEVRTKHLHLFIGIVHDISEIIEAEKKLELLNSELEVKVEERTGQLTEAVNKLLNTNNLLEHQVEKREQIEKELLDSQKELEIALEKEKELNDLKSKFVTMASHEFRTPLGTILSSASLIQKYTEADTQEKREKHIGRIKNSVQNLVNILDDLLSIGKIEEGATELKPSDFDIVELGSEIVAQMQGTAKPGQTVEFNSQWDRKMVRLDPQLFKNICFNLISNAIKYSPEGKMIQVSLLDCGNCFELMVKDEGIGIPEEEQKHMFERFFRANNVTNIQGTGLGLSIVKSYADLMKGELRFESKLDEGTSFFVKLPFKL